MTPEEQAYEQAIDVGRQSSEPVRRLSWPRVGVLIALIVVSAGTTVAFRSSSHAVIDAPSSTFAPYVDVTATPPFAFEDPAVSPAADLVLGFVVSAHGDACQPSWGGAYSLA